MKLQYKSINLNFSDEGKGPAIVLLHGFLETSTMWSGLKPMLLKKNRVICIDLLGHGLTECLGYIHTMDDMADAVEHILNHLRIRRAVFIGHSMGGYVALAFAEHFPDKIKGLCLMNSTSRADSEERKLNRDRAVKAVKQNHKSFIRLSIGNLFRPKNRTVFKEEIKQIKNEALKIPVQGIIAALEGMKIRPDREILLHFTPYPKMMVIGRKDPVLNYSDLLDQTKATEVQIVEFADGHMSHVENLSELSYFLLRFIENL